MCLGMAYPIMNAELSHPVSPSSVVCFGTQCSRYFMFSGSRFIFIVEETKQHARPELQDGGPSFEARLSPRNETDVKNSIYTDRKIGISKSSHSQKSTRHN